MVFWLTGLSGSGKTTLCGALAEYLRGHGKAAMLLDGDMVRKGLCKNLGFDLADRHENVRRIAYCAALAEESDIIACVACIAPLRQYRNMAREIIQSYHEIYIQCPVGICQQRDPKGYYKDAISGAKQLYTGISSPYEAPEKPDLVLETWLESEEESRNKLFAYVKAVLNIN